MRRFLLSVLFLFSVLGAFAQRLSGDKIAVIDSLLQRSHQAYVNVEILPSMEAALEAKSLSEEANYSKGRARGNFYIAQVLSSIGDYDQALEYLSLAEKEKYTSSDPLFYSEISRIQGRVLGMLGMHQSAIRVFKRGMYHIGRIKDSKDVPFLQSMAYDNLSSMFHMIHEYDSAIYYLDKNRELLRSIDEELIYRNLINLYGQYGREFTAREQYDSAAYYLDEALLVAEKYQFPYTVYIYSRRGEMEAKRGDIAAALDNYYKGLNNQRETGIKNGLNSLYQSIAEIYQQLGEPDSSRHYLLQKIELEKELNAANTNALDNAVRALLEEERGQSNSRVSAIILTVILIGALLILSATLFGYFWRKRNKRIIAEKENEVAELEGKLSDAAKEVIELARKNDDAFLIRFNELYPRFIRDIYERHPSLTNSEYSFCVLIYLHFTSKEIAQILTVEHRSVQTRKGRLRKKLKLSPKTDLYHYLKTMGDDPMTRKS